MNEKVWYLGSKRKTLGPMTSGRVRKYIESGKTSGKTKVRREGEEEWRKLQDEHHFFLDQEQSQEDLTEAMSPEEVLADDDLTQPLPLEDLQESDTEKHAVTELAAPPEPPPSIPQKPSREARRKPRRSTEQRRKSKPAPKDLEAPSKDADPEVMGEVIGDDLEPASSTVGEGADPAPGLLERLLGDPSGYQAPAARLEKRDVYRAFRIGWRRPRIIVALSATLAAGLVTLLGAAAAGIGLMLHPVIALLFGGIAGLLAISTLQLGAGALAYQSRAQLVEARSAGAREALGYALRRIPAIALLPFLLTLAPLVPLLILAIAGALQRIPYLGPLGAGLLFILHILLGILTVLGLFTASVSWTLGPVIVGFEDSGLIETARRLLAFVRGSLVTFALRGILPSLAYGAFVLIISALAAAALAVPLAVQVAIVGPGILAGIPLPDLSGGGFDDPGFEDPGFRSDRKDDRRSGSLSPRSGGLFGSSPAGIALPELGLEAAPASLAEVATTPAAYAGQVRTFEVWWQDRDRARVTVTERSGGARATLILSEYGQTQHGAFLQQIGMLTSVDVAVRIADDPNTGALGELIAIRLEGASAARRVAPTPAETAAAAAAKAQRDFEAEARKQARLQRAQAATQAFEAALIAQDVNAAREAMTYEGWRDIDHRDRTKLEDKLRQLEAALAFNRAEAEVKEKLAAGDLSGAHEIAQRSIDGVDRASLAGLRKLVKDETDRLREEAKTKNVVSFRADGQTLTLDASAASLYFLVRQVEFLGAAEVSGSHKDPVRLRVRYSWLHQYSSEASLGGRGIIARGFEETARKADGEVILTFDRAKLKSDTLTLTTR